MMKLKPKYGAVLKGKRGFTLVETMIAVGLVAIISGASITTLKSYLPRYRLSSAAREVFTDLMNARMQAVSKKHQMLITFPSSFEYKITEDLNKDGNPDSGEPTRTYDLQSSFGNVTVTSSSPAIIFKPMGITAGGATITLSLSSVVGTKTVLVSQAGRVRIQ